MNDKLVTETPESKAFADAFETTQADMTDIRKWANLNDVFAEGKLEVWYMRPECFRDYGGICADKIPNPTDLEATHILLGSIPTCPIENLDDAWIKLQGEYWSPNGEANQMIRALGLRHTSMSVGDCFRFAGGDVFRVDVTGFTKLGSETFETRTFKKVK